MSYLAWGSQLRELGHGEVCNVLTFLLQGGGGAGGPVAGLVVQLQGGGGGGGGAPGGGVAGVVILGLTGRRPEGLTVRETVVAGIQECI